MHRRTLLAALSVAALFGVAAPASADDPVAPEPAIGSEAVEAPARAEAPVAIAAPLSVTVSPDSGLKDGDTITISWTNATPGSTINVVQCSGESSAMCDMPNAKLGVASPAASGSTTFTVRTGPIGEGTCGTGQAACALLVNEGWSRDATRNAKPSITFAAAAPTTTTAPGVTTTVPAGQAEQGQSGDTTATTAETQVLGRELARTGSHTPLLAATALLALVLGACCVQVGRRPRRR